jgi:hypothetical protein
MPLAKRLRGFLLRMVLSRGVAIAVGLALLVPALWLFVQEFRWESNVTDGLGLILGATGAALILAGLGGRRPDWYEPD